MQNNLESRNIGLAHEPQVSRYVMDCIHRARETGAKELALSRQGLATIPDQLFELVHLQRLDLSGNRLTEAPEGITRLTNLTELDLSFNQLTELPETVTQLMNLTSLSLSSNYFTAVPEGITRLTNLTTLDLSHNRLKAVPRSFTRLMNLTSLSLGGNRLTEVPKSITRLTNLTSLDLSRNRLTGVPRSITRLTNLKRLDLSRNRLAAVPESITLLTSLTKLYLGSNGFTAVPESIARLTNLKQLYLGGNGLTELPDDITQLANLTMLILSRNKLKAVPEGIARLTNLTTLDLSVNELTALPESLTQLANLTELYLSGNHLKALPESFIRLTKLTTLILVENPIETPPPEVATQGIEAIRAYYRQLEEEGKDYLFEAKLLIVGEAGAGKTSLAKKLVDPQYVLQPAEKSTEGIEVTKWEFPIENNRLFRVNVWDFGGQEIYHATHQFFLTKRSIYVLVADTRKEDTDFYYWLNVVGLLSGDSPLLIVKNEMQERQRDINERQLKAQYENLKEVLGTNLDTNRGLEEIVQEIKHQITHLPNIGSRLPRTWVRLRERLEHDDRNYISHHEFLLLCDENGINPKDKEQVSDYLHKIGVILHFQEDPLLKQIIILKPNWGTEAVYRVLDNNLVQANYGRFRRVDLKQIWNGPEYNGLQDELAQLMVNFKLCYKIPGTERYIAPQLLGDQQPDYDWDESGNLSLRYTYEFMPKGILTQFIVVMHEFIERQALVWKSGVVLE